jgi:hypothetical protein
MRYVPKAEYVDMLMKFKAHAQIVRLSPRRGYQLNHLKSQSKYDLINDHTMVEIQKMIGKNISRLMKSDSTKIQRNLISELNTNNARLKAVEEGKRKGKEFDEKRKQRYNIERKRKKLFDKKRKQHELIERKRKNNFDKKWKQ